MHQTLALKSISSSQQQNSVLKTTAPRDALQKEKHQGKERKRKKKEKGKKKEKRTN